MADYVCFHFSEKRIDPFVKKNDKRYFFRLFVFRFVFLQNFQFSVVSVICPTYHLSYISFVLHIICHTETRKISFVIHFICPTSFVLHLIYPTHHLFYREEINIFFLNFICSIHHLSYT